ncbi:MAG: DUF4236 domain-containing protein [Mesorhizobium sp.]|uniref:DUF4236 domain-containing protein n=1 Tax=Mesorhizobium sp. TaxID=1871066 RepID=UPI000FEA28E4|nr:MAG: DUF4236 domain-containing protein [Mesorhizobium sp.]TJV75637.1 MAG: DUF4236 domain-containing protein [Mesorhizobium sp.]
MGWRFRKSVRLMPGVRLNVGKRSISVSAGLKGFKTTIGSSGRTTTVGIPGTGISHTSRKGRSRKAEILPPQVAALASIDTVSEPLPRSPARRWVGWAIILFIALCVFARYSR